jgi:hypothetical protein
MGEQKKTEQTTAQRLQFQPPFLGIMAMAGRDKHSDNARI